MTDESDEFESDDFIVDDSEDQPPPPPPDQRDELNQIRVKKLSRARRTAYRAQSYTIVGLVGCVVGAIELLRRIVMQVVVQGTMLWYHLIFLGLAALLLWWVWCLWRRLGRLRQEACRSALCEPDVPPEFEPLSDGRQYARNLEDMDQK